MDPEPMVFVHLSPVVMFSLKFIKPSLRKQTPVVMFSLKSLNPAGVGVTHGVCPVTQTNARVDVYFKIH